MVKEWRDEQIKTIEKQEEKRLDALNYINLYANKKYDLSFLK